MVAQEIRITVAMRIHGAISRASSIWLLLPAATYLVIFFLLPVASLLRESLDDLHLLANYARLFQSTVYAQVAWNTAKLSLVVTTISLVLAYPFAYWMTTLSSRCVRAVLVLVTVPFWTSILVRSYSWLVLLQREGLINNLLGALGLIDQPLPLVYNFLGVTCGVTYIMVPYMILTLYSNMRVIDPSLQVVAQTLGATPTESFLRVFMPLTLPGVGAGCSLIFVLSSGYFITPALLGGRQDTTIAMLIDTQMNQVLDWGFGSALASVLFLGVTMLLLVASRLFRLETLAKEFGQ